MCNACCGAAAAAVGAALLVLTAVFGFAYLPGIIEDGIINGVILLEDTIQLERFQTIPYPMDFKVRVFNITNVAEVLAGGQPQLQERGPYVYKLYRERLVEDIDEDTISYRMLDHYEFDAQESFPFTEDDVLNIANTPYNAILQSAEASSPNLMSVLNLASNGIFGQHNSPVMSVPFRDLAFGGIRMCESPGLLAQVACLQIRELAADSPNLVVVDGVFQFTLFGYRLLPTGLFAASRGVRDVRELGALRAWERAPGLPYWPAEPDNCNMLNGTDSAIYAPFLDREQSLWAFNPDICRSLELRYQYDTQYQGLDLYRFAANEWFLDNHEGCFCLNQTAAGCLLPGAMELNSCVGAPVVISYPHFLFADEYYLNGVQGMSPDVESHRIFLDIEPNTGTAVQGAKRVQFNIFLRPIAGIAATQNLRGTLTPIFWIEEVVGMPEEFVNLIRTSLYLPFTVLRIAVPVVIALSSLVLLIGLGCLAKSHGKKTLA